MTNIPKVSIVITNAKGKDLLMKALESIKNVSYKNFEVVVVDCLTKNIKEIREKYPFVRLIHFEEDIGASESHNVGVLNISSETKYILFLDNDVVIPPNSINPLIKILEDKRFKNVAILQPLIFDYENKEKIQSAGYLIFANGVSYPLIKKREIAFLCSHNITILKNIFNPHGAAYLIRREVAEKLIKLRIGIYHDFFFISADDMDLGWKVNLMGYHVALTNASRIYHKGNPFIKISGFRLYHEAKNRISAIIMNYELKNILPALFLKFFHDFYISFILHKIIGLRALIRAYYWILKNINLLLIRRKIIQTYLRRINDSILKKKKLILSNSDWIRFFVFHISLNDIKIDTSFYRVVDKQIKK